MDARETRRTEARRTETLGTRRKLRHVGLRVLFTAGIAIGAAASAVTAVGVVTSAEGFLAFERLNPTRLDSVRARSGAFGRDGDGAALNLGVMGDSLAVGYGGDDPDRVPGVLVAEGLAEASGHPVELTNVAEVGAESTALLAQLERLRAAGAPDVVVIIIGANDVMHVKRLTDALSPLSRVVRDLRHSGAQVVVATCPDLGTVRSFSQPLRYFAHWYSRVLATGQTIIVLRAGGRTVSLADTLGPLFRRDPADMFSTYDHLHPSSRGYEAAAEVILPGVRVAAGFPLPVDAHLPHRVYRRGSRHPLAWWAFRASRRVGTRMTAASSTVRHEAVSEG